MTRTQLGTESMDEAELLADAIAGVMKHVPLPDKEIGIVGDLGTLGMALYLTVGMRLDVDKQIRQGKVAVPAAPVPAEARPAFHEGTVIPVPPRQSEPTVDQPPASRLDAATMLEGLGDAPLVARAQGHVVGEVPVQPGPRDALPFDTDPERELFARTQPVGAQAAKVEELVQPGSDVLDRIAPAPEFAAG